MGRPKTLYGNKFPSRNRSNFMLHMPTGRVPSLGLAIIIRWPECVLYILYWCEFRAYRRFLVCMLLLLYRLFWVSCIPWVLGVHACYRLFWCWVWVCIDRSMHCWGTGVQWQCWLLSRRRWSCVLAASVCLGPVQVGRNSNPGLKLTPQASNNFAAFFCGVCCCCAAIKIQLSRAAGWCMWLEGGWLWFTCVAVLAQVLELVGILTET